MDRYPLRRLKLRTGEEHSETLEVVIEPFTLGGQAYVAAPATLEAGLTVQRAVGGDVFHLRLETALEGPCMRCLGSARIGLAAEGMEVHDSAAGAPAELRSDYIDEGDLLVSAWARDIVGAEIPDRVLCRPGCRGLCPVCGLPLEGEDHEHEPSPRDARWDALTALRDELATAPGGE